MKDICCSSVGEIEDLDDSLSISSSATIPTSNITKKVAAETRTRAAGVDDDDRNNDDDKMSYEPGSVNMGVIYQDSDLSSSEEELVYDLNDTSYIRTSNTTIRRSETPSNATIRRSETPRRRSNATIRRSGRRSDATSATSATGRKKEQRKGNWQEWKRNLKEWKQTELDDSLNDEEKQTAHQAMQHAQRVKHAEKKAQTQLAKVETD